MIRKIDMHILVGILVSVWLTGMLISGLSTGESEILVDTDGENTFGIPRMASDHVPIFIDGDDPLNNWTVCDAVTGTGSEVEPYVIRDLVIDAEDVGSGIDIWDSSVFAELINCSIFNTTGSPNSGIRIINSTSISVINCTLFDNYNGIYLYDSDGITLVGNNITTNVGYGIQLTSSHENTLLDNILSFNGWHGIYLYLSSGNTLSNNTVTTSNEQGISLYSSDENTLSRNEFSANGFAGIHMIFSDDCILVGNNCSDNVEHGIFIYKYGLDNVIYWNFIHGNPIGIEIDTKCTASIFDNWIWHNANFDIYEHSVESSSDYPYNIYTSWVASHDLDHDGLSNWQELNLLSSPIRVDTDDDNFLDGYEVLYGSDPTDPLDYPAIPMDWYDDLTGLIGNNTDQIAELWFWADENATLLMECYAHLDGNVTLLETVLAIATQNTAHLETLNSTMIGNVTEIRAILDDLGISVGDTDYDGLDDLEEITYGTSITCSDTDCDNLNDAFEIKYGTNPLNDDSDGDTWLDGVEAAAGTDPKNASDYPGSTPLDDDEQSLSSLTYAGIGGGVVLVGAVALLAIRKKKV